MIWFSQLAYVSGSVSLTTLLAVVFGSRRMHLPISAWQLFQIQCPGLCTILYNKTGRTSRTLHHTIRLAHNNAPWGKWVQTTIEHPATTGKECTSCLSDVLLNPFVTGECGGPCHSTRWMRDRWRDTDMPSDPHLEGQTRILASQPAFSCWKFVLALMEWPAF